MEAQSTVGPIQERVMKIAEEAIVSGKEIPEKPFAILMDLMNKEIAERQAMSAANLQAFVADKLEQGMGYPAATMPGCVVSEIGAGTGDMFHGSDQEVQHHISGESPTTLPMIPGINDAIKTHYEATVKFAYEQHEKNEDNEDVLASTARWPRQRHRRSFSSMYDLRPNCGDSVALDASKFPQKFVDYLDACVPRKNWANAIINHCDFEVRQHNALTQKLIVQSICDHFKLTPPTPEDLGEAMGYGGGVGIPKSYPFVTHWGGPQGFNDAKFTPLDEDAIAELFPNGPPTGFQG